MSIELLKNDINFNNSSNNNTNICGKYDNRYINDISQSETKYSSSENLSRQKDNRSDATYYVSIDRDNNTSLNKKCGIQIFRFKFTPEFMCELFQFSKIHQYDERKDFKEAWIKWIEENKELIESEVNRLTNLAYDGDILDKMFKSARYYFRKKSNEKKEPKQRKQYIGVNKELLDAMDIHIEENIEDSNYQPKNGFVEFCKDNETLLKDIISNMIEKGINDREEIQNKIKKTYKNRYFMFIKNNDTNKIDN
jgi:hypothetical protein